MKIEISTLRRMIMDGKTTREIADHFGVMPPAVVTACNRHGISKPRVPWAKSSTKKIQPTGQLEFSEKKQIVRVGDRVQINELGKKAFIQHRIGTVAEIRGQVAKCKWDGNKTASSIHTAFIDFVSEGDISKMPKNTDRIGALLATDGKYAALAAWGAQHGLTAKQAVAAWHRRWQHTP